MCAVLQVTWYEDSGKRRCNLLRSSSGPGSDILAAAPMQGYPTLATACYNGEVGAMPTCIAHACIAAYAPIATGMSHCATAQTDTPLLLISTLLPRQLSKKCRAHKPLPSCHCCHRRCGCGTWRVARCGASCCRKATPAGQSTSSQWSVWRSCTGTLGGWPGVQALRQTAQCCTAWFSCSLSHPHEQHLLEGHCCQHEDIAAVLQGARCFSAKFARRQTQRSLVLEANGCHHSAAAGTSWWLLVLTACCASGSASPGRCCASTSRLTSRARAWRGWRWPLTTAAWSPLTQQATSW